MDFFIHLLIALAAERGVSVSTPGRAILPANVSLRDLDAMLELRPFNSEISEQLG